MKNIKLKKELKFIDKKDNDNISKSKKDDLNTNLIEIFKSNLKEIESKIKDSDYPFKSENQYFSALLDKHETQKINLFDALNKLEKESEDLIKNITLVSQKEKENKEKLFNKLEADELQIKSNLDIKGLLIAKKTYLNKIKLEKGNKKIDVDENRFDIKNFINLDFIFGDNRFGIENIVKIKEFYGKVKVLCNDKNKFCSAPTQEERKNYDLRQQEILEDMMLLKNEATIVIENLNSNKE